MKIPLPDPFPLGPFSRFNPISAALNPAWHRKTVPVETPRLSGRLRRYSGV